MRTLFPAAFGMAAFFGNSIAVATSSLTVVDFDRLVRGLSVTEISYVPAVNFWDNKIFTDLLSFANSTLEIATSEVPFLTVSLAVESTTLLKVTVNAWAPVASKVV